MRELCTATPRQGGGTLVACGNGAQGVPLRHRPATPTDRIASIAPLAAAAAPPIDCGEDFAQRLMTSTSEHGDASAVSTRKPTFLARRNVHLQTRKSAVFKGPAISLVKRETRKYAAAPFVPASEWRERMATSNLARSQRTPTEVRACSVRTVGRKILKQRPRASSAASI